MKYHPSPLKYQTHNGPVETITNSDPSSGYNVPLASPLSSGSLPAYGAPVTNPNPVSVPISTNDVTVQSYEPPSSYEIQSDYSSPSSNPFVNQVQDEVSVAYNKPNSNAYSVNEWKPIVNTHPNNPYNYGPPPPAPPPRPSKPTYSRKPSYYPPKGNPISVRNRQRRPTPFEGSKKKPYPIIRPYQRTRWAKNLSNLNLKIRNFFG